MSIQMKIVQKNVQNTNRHQVASFLMYMSIVQALHYVSAKLDFFPIVPSLTPWLWHVNEEVTRFLSVSIPSSILKLKHLSHIRGLKWCLSRRLINE